MRQEPQGIMDITAIEEIRADMQKETGDDQLFIKVFRKYRGSRITGIDREIRKAEHAQIRREFGNLTDGAGGQHAVDTTKAIKYLSRKYGYSRRSIYRIIFRKL